MTDAKGAQPEQLDALLREARQPHYHSPEQAVEGRPCHGGCIQGRLATALSECREARTLREAATDSALRKEQGGQGLTESLAAASLSRVALELEDAEDSVCASITTADLHIVLAMARAALEALAAQPPSEASETRP